MQATAERPTAPPWQLDEDEIRTAAEGSHGHLHDLVDELAEEIAFTLLPGVPVPGIDYPVTALDDALKTLLRRFNGQELDDWVRHIGRREHFEQVLTARIAPAACELIVRSIREGWSEQEHLDAVLKLARDFVPRSEDLRALQASGLRRDEEDKETA